MERGRILEEAAGILRRDYGAWVKAECRLEPRTAYGYRKAYRVLGHRGDWLAEHRVSPSVAVILAAAREPGREAAMEAIGSGRFLTASEARRIVRGPVHGDADTIGFATLQNSALACVRDALAVIGRLSSRASCDLADDDGLEEYSTEAKAILPLVRLLLATPENDGTHPVTRAIETLSNVTGREDARAACRVLAQAIAEISTPDPVAPAVGEAAASGDIVATDARSSYAPTVVEICAGAGGLAVGLSEAGYRHIAMVEQEPNACETLRARFGADLVLEGDVADYDPAPENIGPLDLLSGGVPCQPFSKLGLMGGAGDDRNLFSEAIRLVEKLRPRAVMLENVAGIFAPNFDTYRFEILGRLERAGYVCEWRTLDASHFGVPQKRIRTFLVGFREAGAMVQFRWPQAVEGFDVRPRTVFDAIEPHLRSGGWQPTPEIRASMARAAPTLTGASDRKSGWDLGRRNVARVWRRIGFATTRLGDGPPTADHKGPIHATNAMLAAIQGFPDGHHFRGSEKRIAKQIANALPPAVALHLGRAIAKALMKGCAASAPTFQTSQ